jgi:acyl-CoA synthetase
MRPFLTLHHPAAARRYYAERSWREQTLYHLLAAHEAARPDAAAARDATRTLTWRELLTWVDGTAAHLRGLGLVGGDRVSIWMPSRLEVLVTFLACARERFACNPSLHRTHLAADVAALVEALGSKVLLTEPGWDADRLVDPVAHFAGVGALTSVLTPESFPLPGAASGPPGSDPDSVVYLAFTSGTTGLPKCVMHSDNTLLANARDLVRDWGQDASTRVLSLSPLSHHIAWVAVAQWLVCGGMFNIGEPPAGRSRLDWLIETRATYVMGVPTHAMDVLAEQRARGIAKLGEVRIFYMAGSPIPPVVAEGFAKQGIAPQNIYGMTENSSHQYTHPGDPPDIAVGTCGRGGPGYEVAIFDPAARDRRLGPGETGEIGGRGAALMLGYYDNQRATEASFNRDGWFLSGDLGRLDAAGNLTILGRSKDLVIRGGHNIHPADIEARAVRSPAIRAAAAFGVPDERLGELVCLAVISEADPDAILAHLAAEGLSRYDMPEFILPMEAFPLTASGKILKRDIQAQVARGELVPVAVRHRGDGEGDI